jgi:hypothetical protein
VLTRLARWWLARRERRQRAPEAPRLAGECICGRELHGEDLHLVVAVSDDDSALGIDGHTAMSADFCAEHCPGGCTLGCVPSEA